MLKQISEFPLDFMNIKLLKIQVWFSAIMADTRKALIINILQISQIKFHSLRYSLESRALASESCLNFSFFAFQCNSLPNL